MTIQATPIASSSQLGIVPGKWVKGTLLKPLFGLTPEAARKKREKGAFLEEKHWRYAPDGNVMYNWRAIEEWYEGRS